MFSNDGEIPESLAKRKAVVNPILANGLDFDAHDLEANRNNLLSDRQRQQLDKQRAKIAEDIMFVSTLLGVGIGIVGIIIFSTGDYSYREQHFEWLVAGGILILPLIVTLIIGLFIVDSTVVPSIVKDIEKGVVLYQMGTVILDKRVNRQNNSGISEQHFLIMNEQEFILSREAFLRFKNLDRYTIYYAPYSKIILSAEPA